MKPHAAVFVAIMCGSASLVAPGPTDGDQSSSRKDEPVSVVLSRVPEKARMRHSPLENDPEAAIAGKKLYEQHCSECHGATAEGSTRGPSLRSSELQHAEPGEIFWIVTNGVVRRGMPAWSKLPDAQRWQIITFLRGQ